MNPGQVKARQAMREYLNINGITIVTDALADAMTRLFRGLGG